MSTATKNAPRHGTGIDGNTRGRTSKEFRVVSHVVHTEVGFGAHRHPEHQLAWMRDGRMELQVGGDTWNLHSGHVVWLPGNVMHEMTLKVGDSGGEMISAYAAPDLRPVGARWAQPMVLAIDELTAQLLLQLAQPGLDRHRRFLCQSLLYNLLESAPERHDVLAVPRDARARVIAARILADPSDPRELGDWAREAGVSAKTLMRAFAADTGTTFSRWRTRARMYAAVDLLVGGSPVHTVAAQVGYDTPSGFIGAFRATFGTTPASYVRERMAGQQRTVDGIDK